MNYFLLVYLVQMFTFLTKAQGAPAFNFMNSENIIKYPVKARL